MNNSESSSYTISQVGEADSLLLEKIAWLSIIAWHGQPTEEAVATRAKALNEEIAEAAALSTTFFVARHGDYVVGYVRLKQCREYPSLFSWEALAVHPDHRRRGIARELFARSVEHAKAHWGVAVFSETHLDNEPSIALHRALGFRELGSFSAPADGDKKVGFVLPLGTPMVDGE